MNVHISPHINYLCKCINLWLSCTNARCKAAVSQGLVPQRGNRLLRPPSVLQIKTNSGALLFTEVYDAILFPGAQHPH